MSASYPTSVKAFATRSGGTAIGAAHVNDLQDETSALETALLTTGLAHDLKFVDATYDIGKTGATRPRDLFLSRNATVGGTLAVTGTLTAAGVQRLLYANSGTDTNASAATVDSIAISGLTAKDTLLVYLTMESVTQATANPRLYNSTDSVTVLDLMQAAAALGSGGKRTIQAQIRQYQSASTAVGGVGFSVDGTLANNATVTNWAGSWTLGIRHTGVTAGGTFRYSWSVYVLPGQ